MNKVEQVASVQSLSTITGIENQHPLINPAKVSPTQPRTGGQKYRSNASGKANSYDVTGSVYRAGFEAKLNLIVETSMHLYPRKDCSFQPLSK